MFFDGVVGNPSYQNSTANTSDEPVYNYFIETAFKLADISDFDSLCAVSVQCGQDAVSTSLVGCTQTFITVGAFDTRAEADVYIKNKFCRVMLGILKITQDNPLATWAMVPLQDFTSASDIDWRVPIPQIDEQLYRKYGLDDAEIKFIEIHVKAMT